MARKKLLAVAIGMLMPAAAQALTLDQITVGSLLDQPLKAAIEVTAERPGELDSLRIGLASAKRFAEKGIPRPDMLEDLRFEVVRQGSGKALVIVTTSTPVKEPFLDFLVEATWESGQATREYTILLDPQFSVDRPPPPIELPGRITAPEPVAAQNAAEAAAPPAPARESAVARGPVAEEAPAEPAAPPAPAPLSPERGADRTAVDRVTVVEGDTLWSIAERVRPDTATVYQTLDALHAANPHAFLDGNVDLMLEGAVLRVPAGEDIAALDPRSAERLLAGKRRTGRPATPASAGATVPEPPRAEAVVAGDEAAGTPRVRLAAADATTSGPEAGQARGEAPETARTAELERQLLMERENAANIRQEAAGLRSRLSDLEAQLRDAARLIALKDEQLARLQAYYAAQAAERATPGDETEGRIAGAVAPGARDRHAAAGADAAGEQRPDRPAADTVMTSGETPPAPVVDSTAAAPGGAMAARTAEATDSDDGPGKTGALEPAPKSESAAVEPVSPAATSAEPGEGEVEHPAPAEAVGPETAVPETAAPETTPPEAKARDTAATGARVWTSWLDDLPGLAVIGAVAVAGLVGLLVLLRRRRAGELEVPQVDARSPASDRSAGDEAESSAPVRLAEIDALLTRGDFTGARAVALKLLASKPTEPQVVLKLLEVYRALGEGTAFSALARKLSATGFAADYPDVWTRVKEMGRELVPEDRLFEAEVPPVQAQTAVREKVYDMDEMLAGGLDEGDAELRQQAADLLGDVAAHRDTRGESPPSRKVTSPLSTQPELADTEPGPDESVDLEQLARSQDQAQGGIEQGSAAGLADAIEFDIATLESPSLPPGDVPATDSREGEGDAGGLSDALAFTASPAGTGIEPEGEAAAADSAAIPGALEYAIPATASGPDAIGGPSPGDLDKIVSLRRQEPPLDEGVPPGDEDEVQTKLDLARAFIDLGDGEGARSILEEVLAEGNVHQREEAESLLSSTA